LAACGALPAQQGRSHIDPEADAISGTLVDKHATSIIRTKTDLAPGSIFK
jgi:hypothetical protein